jgi:uncharacterized membrane protein YfcA
MTPMLILVFGVTPITAIGSDLTYAAVTKTVGGYKHWRQRTVDVQLFRLSPTRVVGTDVFHAAILLWAAGLAHVSAGNVDFGLVGTILIGSIPGVWVGSHWSVRVEPAVLRTTLAVVLIGAGLALLIKAGLGIPLEVIVPFPVAVMVLLVVTMARSGRARKDRESQIPFGM